MRSMSFFLALDVGATKTDYLLANDTRHLARVRTPTIKRMRTDAESATRHLESALTQLTALSGISMHSITRTCVGTAGETVPLVSDWLRESIGARVSGDLLLLGDVEIALDAAFPGASGVLVLAGTGSNVAGRTPDRLLTTAGGYGPAVSDQGSGYRIGSQALRALFLAHDERRPTLLEQAILDLWQLPSLNEIVDHANRLPPPDFSQLTELVLRCANNGDQVAAAVLAQAGEELGYLVVLIMRRLQLASTDSAAAPSSWVPPLAFAGSIMEKVLPVRHALIAFVRREFPDVQTLEGVVDPVAGALFRARNGSPTAA